MSAVSSLSSVPLTSNAVQPTATQTAATSAPATTTAATQQATAGAAAAQPKAEAFNAPALDLPEDPTTRDVMDGLVGAMADPSVNDTSSQRLYEIHQQIFEAEKAMMQVVLDGMR